MNSFTFTQRKISAKLFAGITMMSLLLSAFPAAFFVAEAATNTNTYDVSLVASPASGNTEYVEVTNNTASDFDMSNIEVREAGSGEFYSYSNVLLAGDSFRICANETLSAACDDQWTGGDVMNNSGGDTVSFHFQSNGNERGSIAIPNPAVESEVYTGTFEIVTVSVGTVRDVNDDLYYASINDAMAAATTLDGDVIELTDDLTIGTRQNLNREITLEGNGFTIDAAFAKDGNSDNAAIGIGGDGVTVQNITLDGSNGSKLHGINVYEAVDVTVSNVHVQNFRSGMVVNGSTVNADDYSTSGNTWHGINVAPGSGVTAPSVLNISDTSAHDENSANPPSGHTDGVHVAHIFSDDATLDVTVNDIDNQYNHAEVLWKGQQSDVYTLKSPDEKKVDICHFHQNGYNAQNVSINSISGNNGHSSHVNDIIPEVTGEFAGQNLTTDYNGLSGAEVLANDCVVPPVEQCVNLLTNGSFEEEEVTNGSLWQKFASVTGWLVGKVSDDSATTLELHENLFGNQAAAGDQYAELDGDHSTRVSQTVPTLVGGEYELKWAFAPRHNISADQNDLSVLIDGVEVATNGPESGSAGLSSGDWTRSTYTFTAADATTDIAFADNGPSNSFGTYLDDAQLCLVAEPEPVVNLHAAKIVCTDEADLPNGDVESPVTVDTAADWLEANPNSSCSLVEDWEFEWGTKNTPRPNSTFTGTAGGDWTTFSGSTAVPLSAIGNDKSFWVREVLPEGYVPFSYGGPYGSDKNYTAELNCHIDGINFDNADRVDKPEEGGDYYCVAWNAPVDSDPNDEHHLNISGEVYEDIAVDDCDNRTECLFSKTNNKLAGWEMRLYKEVAGIWTEIATSTTDNDGIYRFPTQYDAGVYHTCEVPQTGYAQGIGNWNGSGYLVNTANLSGALDEGPYCNTYVFTDASDKSSKSHFGNAEIKNPIVYGAYCGDGEVNQDWEQCEGDNEAGTCNVATCQYDNQCTELNLVKINLEESESVSFNDTIYLGSALNPVPSGIWFNFDEAGDATAGSIANSVDGLGVERDQVNQELYLAFKGGNGSKHIDRAHGTIEFIGAEVNASTVDRIPNPQFKLENGSGVTFDDVFDVTSSTTINFDMQADTGNDGVTVGLEDVNICEVTPEPEMCYAPVVEVVFDEESDIQSYQATGTTPGTLVINPVDGGYEINLYNLSNNSSQTASGTIIFPTNIDLSGFTLEAGSGDDLEGADSVTANGNEITFSYRTTNGSDTIILKADALFNEDNCTPVEPDMCYLPYVVSFTDDSDESTFSTTTGTGLVIEETANGYTIGLYDDGRTGVYNVSGTITFPAGTDTSSFTLTEASLFEGLEQSNILYPDTLNRVGNEIEFDLYVNGANDIFTITDDSLENAENCSIDTTDPGDGPGDGDGSQSDTFRISGVKWDDVNGNGILDDEESTLSGWNMFLTEEGSQGAPEQATTDKDGAYSFEVAAGTWIVTEESEFGWTQTGQYQDGDSIPSDSDAFGSCVLEIPSQDVEGNVYTCSFGNQEDEELDTFSESDSDSNRGGGDATRIRRVDRPEPLVLGATTDTPQMCPFLTEYMQISAANDTMEVMKLQAFLNIFKDLFGGTENPITGTFGSITDANVKAFQETYRTEVLDPWFEQGIVPHDRPTGYVYKTTLWKINSMVCPDGAAYPDFSGENLLSNVDNDINDTVKD